MIDYQQKVEHFTRMLIPALFTLFLFIISISPIGFWGFAYFPIDVCLISIYYWTIFRPKTLPFWFVFVLGLVKDSLMGTALGLSSLIYILFRMIVFSQQRHWVQESFFALWFGFGMLCVPTLASQWLIASALAKSALPALDAVIQWAITFAFYPVLHILFNAVYRFLPKLTKRPKSQKPHLL